MTASSLDSAYAPVTGARNLWPLLPAGVAVFGASALVYYHTHPDAVSTPPSALQHVVIGVYSFLGFAPGFMLLVLLLSWSSVWWFTSRVERVGARAIRLLAFTIALAVLINLREVTAQPHTGALGWWIAERLASLFGPTLSTMLMAPLAVASLILATDGFFYRYFEGMMRPDEVGSDPAVERSAFARPESGVETEATEHLKSLAAEAAAPVAFAEVQAEVLAALQAPGSPPPDADVDPVELAPPSRRNNRRSRWYDEVVESETPALVEPVGAPAAEAVEALAAEPLPLLGAAEAPIEGIEDEFSVAAESMSDTSASAASLPVSAVESAAAAVPDPSLDDVAVVVPRRGNLAPVVGEVAAESDDDREVAPAEPAMPMPSATEMSASTVSAASAGLSARDDGEAPAVAERARLDEPEVTIAAPQAGSDREAEADGETEAQAEAESGAESVVAIPRPPEGVRQQRLFVSGFDDQLVRDAIDLVTQTRRATASLLQRKLRIDYEQAMELLSVLGRRGVIEIGDGETQGRVVGS